MIEKYKDFYGCRATIRPTKDGQWLLKSYCNTRKIRDQVFTSHRGAMRAMQNDSDGTMEALTD